MEVPVVALHDGSGCVAAYSGGGEEAAGAKESRAQQFTVLAAAGGTSQLQLGASDADAGGGLCVTAITDGVAW